MNRIVTILFCLLLLVGPVLANDPPEVTNVVAVQRPHTTLIDVAFDLADLNGDALVVTLWYSLNAGITWDHQCVTVSGDIGSGIAPVAGLSATWDAGVDLPNYINTDFALRIHAIEVAISPAADYVLIPPSGISMPTTFMMGSSVESFETPHQVTLTRRFKIAPTEVSNAQYVEVLQWAYDQGLVFANGSYVWDNLDGSTVRLLLLTNVASSRIRYSNDVFTTTDPDRPVVELSWYAAAAYCDWLSMREGLTRAYNHSNWKCNDDDPYGALGYRLPTEAEWEIACRAGSTTHFSTGNCLNATTEANYRGGLPYAGCSSGPYVGFSTDIGSYVPNNWGLSDMHGNVYEWVNDRFGVFTSSSVTDPPGPVAGASRLLRGGAYNGSATSCRSAARSFSAPATDFHSYGFRPAISDY